MKKRMRGVGLSLLMLCCGAMSFAESPTPTPQKCFDFDTGTNSIIGQYHFSDPDCPKDIVFPDEMTVDGVNYKVHVIGKNFANHPSYSGYLERVIFPKYLKKIEMNAFIGQYRLHTVKFNEWLEELWEASFFIGDWNNAKNLWLCSHTGVQWNLTHLDLPESLLKIGAYAFSCQSLVNLKIPSKITQINEATFWLNKLKSIELPDGLKEIGRMAFFRNDLTAVNLPTWLEKIGQSTFSRNQLSELNIPDSVIELWISAFRFNQLKEVKIGAWVKTIPNACFAENQLKDIAFSEGVEKLDIGAFYKNKIEVTRFPNSLKEIFKRAFEWNPWVWDDHKVVAYMNRPSGDPINPRPTIDIGGDSYVNLIYKVFTLTFNLDGWTGTTLLTGLYNDPLNVEIPIKTGYIFDGRDPILPSKITSDQNFKARWEKVYTLTFDLDGGTGTTLLTGLYNDPLNVVDPTKTWYVFSGRNPTLPSAITGDQNFTAQWKEKSSSSSSSWGGYSGGGGSSHSSTSSSSTSSTQQKPETSTTAEPVKTEQVKTEVFNPTIKTTCFNPLDKQTIDQGNKMSELLRIAHQMLYSYSLTKWQGTKDFAPERSLTRQEAARFMTEFATNVLCRKASRSYNDHFTDLEKANPELLPYIKKSYEYLIFNGDSNAEGKKEKTTFRPKELITVGELSAIMTRLVRNELLEEVKGDRARNYRSYINTITPKSHLVNEIRGTVAEVIYDVYRNNSYELKDIGYVIKK